MSKTGNYATGDALANATIAARLAGEQTNLFKVPGVTVEADRVVTIFAIGNRSGQPQGLRLMMCQDQAPAGRGASNMATCSMLTP